MNGGPHRDVKSVQPGKEIRFAVGDADGRRSSSWRIWTMKNKLDVYMAVRLTAADWKTSFHESGSWSQGFVDESKAVPPLPVGKTRHLDIWQRPAPVFPGWTHAYQIRIREVDLREQTDKPGNVSFIPAPPSGAAKFIDVFFVEPDSPPVEPGPNVEPVGRLNQHNGGYVFVVAYDASIAAEVNENIEADRASWLAKVPDGVRAKFTPTTRIGLHGSDQSGNRFTIETAALPLPDMSPTHLLSGGAGVRSWWRQTWTRYLRKAQPRR